MTKVVAAAAPCCWLIVATAALTIALSPTNLIGQSAVLVKPDDLVHLGAFRLPRPAGAGFTYGGTALAYNATNNSLFVSTSDQRTAEVSIPPIGGTASIIQPIADALGRKLTEVGSAPDGPRIGGHLVWGNKLIITGFLYYDADHVQVNSHFTRPLVMSDGPVEGPARAGREKAGYYSGYMAPIPAEWHPLLGGPALTGNCCLSIISRTSYGPAVASFDPLKIGTAQMLLYYDAAHPTLGRYGDPNPNPIFNGTTKIRGLVFPEGTAGVMFFGTTGTGKWCYGEASECGDPVFPYKGDHAYPYSAYVWAYDARELAAVKSGKKRPWQVVPYASWAISALGPMSLDQVGGVAYDPRTSRLYLSVRNSDGGDKPLIHVFRIGQ